MVGYLRRRNALELEKSQPIACNAHAMQKLKR